MFVWEDGTRQPAKTWTTGGTANKSLYRCIPLPLDELHPWMWAVVPCGSLVAGIADPKVGRAVTTGTAIMHVGRREGWGLRVVIEGQLIRSGFWEV